MEETKYLQEQLEKADKFISQLEDDCYPFIDEIIDIVCKNVIKRMNAEMRKVSLCADFPKNLLSSTNCLFYINPKIMMKYSFQMAFWKITLTIQLS